MFIVNIKKLKIRAKIGTSLSERKNFQLLVVTLKFAYTSKKGKNLNEINNLQNYSEITKFLKRFIELSKYKTLEKLIFECSQAIQKKFKIKKVSLKIEKPEIAKKYGCQSISVSK